MVERFGFNSHARNIAGTESREKDTEQVWQYQSKSAFWVGSDAPAWRWLCVGRSGATVDSLATITRPDRIGAQPTLNPERRQCAYKRT